KRGEIADSANGTGQSPVGCSAHPRRTAQARNRGFVTNRLASDAQTIQATITNLAGFHQEPFYRDGLDRFPNRSNRDLPRTVCIGGACSSSQARGAFQRDRTSDGCLDRAAIHRSISRRDGAALSLEGS